jgi:hypothetical protein
MEEKSKKGRKLVTMFIASAALLGMTGCDVDDDDDIDVKVKAKVKTKEKKKEVTSGGTSGNNAVTDGKKLHTPSTSKSSGG